ncbi:uncharacterized protein PRCAT00002853001 [Priceomyces carsonii]|uniref:uncharacterized protein n=1 Tax=Priceomyces carsonii TaxID=28549 RepID=UPI002EDB14FC|nr:unnamed protein product [Priceomyces carsonii]
MVIMREIHQSKASDPRKIQIISFNHALRNLRPSHKLKIPCLVSRFSRPVLTQYLVLFMLHSLVPLAVQLPSSSPVSVLHTVLLSQVLVFVPHAS